MFNLYTLYIDPGTGSILFSVIAGAAASLYFLLRAFIQKIKFILSGGRVSAKNKVSCKYVIYNEGKQYWNVFKDIVEQFEINKIELCYLTSAHDDPIFNCNYSYIKPEYIGEGNKAFAYLNILSADVVLMTTPGLDVFQLKRSKSVKHYSHILHSPSDATIYRLFGIDYFDSVLLNGDYQAFDIRILEKQRGLHSKQLVTVGCPYLDSFFNKSRQITEEENNQFTVLVSPSWGASSLLTLYGEDLLDPLAESGWRIIIRPHPQSKKSEAAVLKRLQDKYFNNYNIIWDFESDNIYSLKKSNIMISDFSGIIFDFMFLFDRPVIYSNKEIDPRPYDFCDLDHEIWRNKTIRDTCIELNKEDFSKITDVIKNASKSETLALARKNAKETAWQYQGEAGIRAFEFLKNIS